MDGYFIKTLTAAKNNDINILDAYIALRISEKYPNITHDEFENRCSEFKDKYLKNEYVTFEDI